MLQSQTELFSGIALLRSTIDCNKTLVGISPYRRYFLCVLPDYVIKKVKRFIKPISNFGNYLGLTILRPTLSI